MAFETKIIVRFGDVDAAGIVFYPRYLEMLNTAVEDWCAEALGVTYFTMHKVRDFGIPVVDLRVTFSATSVLGDELTVSILPLRIGNSSCDLRAAFSCNGEERLLVEMTVVCMQLKTRRAIPWPSDVRDRIEAGMCSQREAT